MVVGVWMGRYGRVCSPPHTRSCRHGMVHGVTVPPAGGFPAKIPATVRRNFQCGRIYALSSPVRSDQRESLLFALLRLGFGFALSIVTTSGPSSDMSAVWRSVGGSYDVRRMSGGGIASVGRLRACASNC